MSITLTTTLASAPSSFLQGADFTIDYGTTGDYFVDPVNGDDIANNGLTAGAPFATLGKAQGLLENTGGTIKMIGDGVRFREELELLPGGAGSPIIFEPYADHTPIWTGGEATTGWAVCTIADEAVVGSNYVSIYKLENVAKTTFPEDDPNLAHIFEDTTMLNIAIAWAGTSLNDKFFTTDLRQGFTADSVQLDGSNQILSYTDTSVTSTYTAAQIEAATLVGMTNNNTAFTTAITSVSGSVITIDDQTKTYESNSEKDNFILRNIIPGLEQGQWAFLDNGDGTVNLYIWPNDPANVTNDLIEVCTRKSCLWSGSGAVGEWEVHGIKFQHVATSADADGALIYMGGALTTGQNVVIKHCGFNGGSLNPDSKNGLITLAGLENSTIERCIIENAQNAWGIQVFGSGTLSGPGTTFFSNNVVKRCVIRRTTQTPIWTTGLDLFVFAHNRIEETGLGAHGNKSSLYQQIKDVLFWGNTYINTDGYLTFQRASRLNFLFNHAPATRAATASGSRAMDDQQSVDPPSEWENESGECLILNNTFWPQPITFDAITAQPNGVRLGNAIAPSVTFVLKNNILYGIEDKSGSSITTSSNNWDTQDDAPFTVNDVVMSRTTEFTDPSAGDFTLKPGATIRSETGDDISSHITALQSTFSGLFSDWTLDALGNTITHTAPRIGAVVDYDYSTLRGSADFQILTP